MSARCQRARRRYFAVQTDQSGGLVAEAAAPSTIEPERSWIRCPHRDPRDRLVNQLSLRIRPRYRFGNTVDLIDFGRTCRGTQRQGQLEVVHGTRYRRG